ncbi:MAG: 50S ribosomal protein L22 [Candidatus Saccharibacteria bacterium]|nr:50S ribosomal protein L22 [Candidatus Saccharibacteria bacterium]
MSVLAVAKGVNMSPRKVGVVAALIRGRTVEDALTILAHVPRASAIPVRKAVESARANAEHNHNLKPDTLMITEISVSPGTPMKRMRPAAQGRGLPFLRRTCHIRVVVDGETRVVKKAAKPATVKKEAK